MAGSRRGIEVDSLTPYLPRPAIDWAVHTSEQQWKAIDGSLVFIDVSGFTALSERLAKRGPIGAEELTEVLGTCFTELLAVAYAEGGSLLKFGGDALLLLFDGDDHAERAVRSALAMRSTLRRTGRLQTAVGNVRLRMSVGVHSGELHLFRIGGSHKELVLCGPAATHTVEMEATAGAGEIVMSAATAGAVSARFVGPAKGGGFLVRDRSVPTGQAGFPSISVPSSAGLATSIPVALRTHLASGLVESEHRHVSIGFIHFDDVDALMDQDGPEGIAAALDVLVRVVQDAADAHGVTFLGTDIDRDGGKVIVVAGAPEAHDDDEGRMLAALRRVVDADLPLPVRIGLNFGRVFAGAIGPDYRRTYTVMGDAVNLAARLMAAAAPRQVIATGEVLDRARRAYATTALEPFMVKGKSRPVEAFAVGGARASQRLRIGDLPLVGRDKEVAVLVDAWESAAVGAGRVIEVTGEAGMGKSRLLAELRRRVGDAPVVAVAGEPYEVSTPWFVMRQLLLDVLGLQASIPARLAGELAKRVRRIAPDLLPWLPLLGDVIGAPVSPTPESSELDDRFKRTRTNQVLADLLTAQLPGSTVLVFEDMQWIDDASAGALRRLATTVDDRPWLVVVTRRDDVAGGFRAGDVATLSLTLEPLDEHAAAALISAATADAPLRHDERAALVARAGGNPLYLEELLRVHAAGGDAAELPDSVEAIVATAIDRLDPHDRQLLRHAAVLGMEVEPALLAEVVDDAKAPTAAALRRRFGDLVVPDGRGRLRFRNRLVRDVAYEMLPFRRRRELHGRAGDAIERAAGTAADDRAEVLSLHFLEAQRYDKCWYYARAAAQRAASKYANVEAAELWGRAVRAARHLDVEETELAAAWEQSASSWSRAGAVPKAESAYRSARQLRAADPVGLARTYRWEARLAEGQGRAVAAARRLLRGLAVLADATGRDALAERAELEALYGWTRQRRGHHREALRWASRALETARASGSKSAEAEAYLLLDWAYSDLGSPDRATHGREALAIWQALGDLSHQAFALNAMGAFAYWRGEWDDAAELYAQALDAFTRAGNETEAAWPRYNSAEILLDQGHLERAEATLREVVIVYRSVGYHAGLALTNRDLGRIAARRGELDIAERLLVAARDTFATYRLAPKALEVEGYLGDVKLRRGEVAQAFTLAEEGLSQAAAATVRPLLHRIHGYAHMAVGQLTEARAALSASEQSARASGSPYEVALTLDAIRVMAQLEGESPDEAAEAERLTILEALGVQSLPSPPIPG